MKFSETGFAKEITAVVAGVILAVATVAFITIPATLGATPGEPSQVSAAQSAWHPT